MPHESAVTPDSFDPQRADGESPGSVAPAAVTDDLTHLGSSDIDALPFGYIALAPDGTIRKYNRYEADLAGTDPEEVLGKNFFREVAPCTQVQEFEGRFRQLVAGELGTSSLAFRFVFRFRHGAQAVRIGFIRSPLRNEVIVTVNRLRSLDIATTARVETDTPQGRLFDASGLPVVFAGADFWRALVLALTGDAERDHRLHDLGHEWGSRHILRVEALVQREHQTTLREAELQLALECLSGSLGPLGLGHFDVDLGHRRDGLLVVTHRHDPFLLYELGGDGAALDPLLAGLHAGFLSHLAGKTLTGRALERSPEEVGTLQILVGAAVRLERLFRPSPTGPDRALLDRLRRSRRTAEEGEQP